MFWEMAVSPADTSFKSSPKWVDLLKVDSKGDGVYLEEFFLKVFLRRSKIFLSRFLLQIASYNDSVLQDIINLASSTLFLPVSQQIHLLFQIYEPDEHDYDGTAITTGKWSPDLWALALLELFKVMKPFSNSGLETEGKSTNICLPAPFNSCSFDATTLWDLPGIIELSLFHQVLPSFTNSAS
ncbi:hypothetical protein CEXT_463081 [Caerostris extrusa]|uniref:Uncharacterized protein n=1 Tax=Caerostris extrusa TaxID=172846 RepID=A0AAV4TA01_CAEEX|nr:hypothetical protein CEXT_463081 [Caerostris extrusa]